MRISDWSSDVCSSDLLRVSVNREKISMVGSSVAEVGRTVETMMGGRNVTRFKRGSEQYDVIVQVEDKARQTPSDLSSIYVRGKDDEMVQLANLASVTESVAAKIGRASCRERVCQYV